MPSTWFENSLHIFYMGELPWNQVRGVAVSQCSLCLVAKLYFILIIIHYFMIYNWLLYILSCCVESCFPTKIGDTTQTTPMIKILIAPIHQWIIKVSKSRNNKKKLEWWYSTQSSWRSYSNPCSIGST